MKRGTTQAHTLRLNDWSVGDILEGTESNDQGWSVTNRILITAIGEEEFLCKWDYNDGKGFDRPETGSTTLCCREWKKVGEDGTRKSAAGFWGRAAARLTKKNKDLMKFVKAYENPNKLSNDEYQKELFKAYLKVKPKEEANNENKSTMADLL